MNKILKITFFYLILFTNCIFALDLSPKELPLHKNIKLSQDINGIDEAILLDKEFKEFKFFRRYIRKKRDNDNLWLKIDISNSKKESIRRELFTRWNNTSITMYLVKDKKVIYSEKLKNYDNFLRSKPFTLKSKETLDLYLNIKVINALDDYYYIYFLAPENAIDFIVYKEKYFDNGFFLGILIAMMMYNFFMYFSINSKCYLYLGIYQFLIILYTSEIRSYLILLFEDFPIFSYLVFKIWISFFISVLSILFTKEFLNTKTKMPIFDKLLTLSIFILAIYQLNPIEHINYAAILYSLYIFAGLYSFLKGNFSALFYILGFSCTVTFLVGINIIKKFNMDIYFEYQSAIQILAVIEAFALSMALYLKVKEIVKEKKHAQEEIIENEKMLMVQSRFATMGEMLASIAHQWRQPLNHVSMVLTNIQLAKETNKLTTEYLNKKTNEANLQLKYMSDTIEDFTNFFSKKGTLEDFTFQEVCSYSLDLVNSKSKKNNVNICVNNDDTNRYMNYKNELIQVLVIVLNNAIDALMLNNIKDRKIDIYIKQNSITINDNAGGIPNEIVHKIFDPYFTTKNKKFGTGLGLYTAKAIVETLIKGKITVKNIDDGASFTISLP